MPALERDRAYVFPALAILILAALFAVSVYRAATQSIVIDEAFAYLDFLARPNFWRFEFFNAALHVLYAVAAKLSIAAFGLSELTYRLPALVGAVLVLSGLFLVARRLFGDTPWLPLAVLLCGLNPLVLDFLSAARGYGLALGFWVLAVYAVLPPASSGAVAWASVCMGLAVAAQLAFVVPSAALALAAAVPIVIKGPRSRLLLLALPGPAIAAAILAWPMRHATADSFYIGMPSWSRAFDSVARASFERSAVFRVETLAAGFAIVLVVHAALCLKRRRAEAGTLLLLGTLAASLVLTSLLALFVRDPYPINRAGLYLVPLVSLCWLSMVRDLRWKAATVCGTAVAALSIAQYASEFNVSYYDVYRNNASVKKMFDLIRAQSPEDTHVGASWQLADSLNFYRRMHRTENIAQVERTGPGCHFDYYVLLPADRRVVERYSLRLLHRDPVSEAALYRPSDAVLARLRATYPPPFQTSPPCGCEPAHEKPCFARDFGADPAKGGLRWARKRPVLLFRLDPHRAARLRIRVYSPVTPAPRYALTVLINGERAGVAEIDSGAEQELQFAVPPDLIAKYPLTSVEIRPSHTFVTDWGDVLSFQLLSARFDAAPAK